MTARNASDALTIGFVFDDTLDVLDGVQQHIVTLGRELAARGHQVHYLVGETHDSPMDNTHSMSTNVEVPFNGNRMRIPLPASRELIRRTLDDTHFDILHVQAPYSPFMAGQVLSLADDDTGVVATYHIASADWASRLGGSLLGAINHHTHRRVDEVIAVSQVAGEYATRTARVRGTVIPNPIDVAHFSQVRAAPQGFPERGNHVVFLGRFVERKGADLLLDAVEYGELHGLFPKDFHVTFAGKGPLLDSCKSRASRLHTPIAFLGYVPEDDKPALLRSADIAVFPATGGESFGIVLLEAIAAGAGVTLAGDNAGYHSTLLGDPDALFSIDEHTHARDLAERISLALTSRQWSHALHERERQLLERYDVRTVADQVERVYAHALAKRRG
ncbi:glycosyltransferase family 4 protein [Bifidobacterium gallicum]|nr:glycosyltransferase family 4 protein [Bifidobacterium gallicum]KFI57295.1 phosphatidyl-myo-inositol alpha-mannosyltransferase [Bifidobacterium gallicum DSM 20093 = LMG 11596]